MIVYISVEILLIYSQKICSFPVQFPPKQLSLIWVAFDVIFIWYINIQLPPSSNSQLILVIQPCNFIHLSTLLVEK